MNLFNKILFNIIQLLISVFSSLLYFLNLIFLFVFIIIIFHLDHNSLIKYSSLSIRSHIYLHASIIIFMIIIMILSLIIICHYIQQLINNLKLNKYFVDANVLYIRNTIFSMLTLIICNIFLNVYLFINKINNITNISIISHTSIMNYIIYFVILVISYVIYNIFKYGVKLQKDSDSFI